MREKTNQILGGGFDKPLLYRLNKRREKPALTGRHYPSIKRLPSEEIIFDPTTNKSRTIRYAVGEPSIFKDEQPEKVVLGDIVFSNGSIRVNKDNPELIDFLDASNHNTDNPNRKKGSKPIFSVVDAEKKASVQVDKELDQSRAIVIVGNMDFDDLRSYARVLGVDTGRGAKEIRHDMIVLAKADPAGFISGIDDPITKRQQVLLDAREYNLIAIDNRSFSWVLGDKKSLIVPIPTGMDSLTWIAEWTLNNKDGEKVYNEVLRKLKAVSE